MKLGPIVRGLLSFIPGANELLPKRKNGSADSSEGCYYDWLKHLGILYSNGVTKIPNTFAELGPGDSLGVGFAALLSGANVYYAMDIYSHANTEINLKVFDGLVELFKARAPRPWQGFPNIDEYLDENLFPSNILTEELRTATLANDRIQRIRKAIENLGTPQGEILIEYKVPYMNSSVIEKESVDLLFSNAVLEHIEELDFTYKTLYTWLKPNGIMTHLIDFDCHNLTKQWNGYRKINEILWKILVGKKMYLINRQPVSVHLDLIQKNGFKILCNLKKYRTDGIKRSELASKWKNISDDDLTCVVAFIQAQK